MKVYLAGPMRGYDDSNFPAFAEATQTLRDLNYVVLSPHEYSFSPDKTIKEYMTVDLPHLLSCDMVAVLDGWQGSQGARIETYVAFMCEMPVRAYNIFERGLTQTLHKYDHPDIVRNL